MAAEHAERQRAIESRIAAELSGVERQGHGFSLGLAQVAVFAAVLVSYMGRDSGLMTIIVVPFAGALLTLVVGRYQDAEKRRLTRTDFASVQLESPHDDTPPESDHPLHPNSHLPLGT